MQKILKKLLNYCVGFFFLTLIVNAAPPLSRNIFLNGKDVSNVRSQKLKNVDVQIDDKGDIVITAAHYQVREQESYRPLGSPKLETPPHMAPIKEPATLPKPEVLQIPEAIKPEIKPDPVEKK